LTCLKEWKRKSWGNVNGVGYVDIECKHTKSENERLSSNRLKKERWWNTNIIVWERKKEKYYDRLERKIERGWDFDRLDKGWDFDRLDKGWDYDRVCWMQVQRENERYRLSFDKLEREGF
jgi:hypothetical protein